MRSTWISIALATIALAVIVIAAAFTTLPQRAEPAERPVADGAAPNDVGVQPSP